MGMGEGQVECGRWQPAQVNSALYLFICLFTSYLFIYLVIIYLLI